MTGVIPSRMVVFVNPNDTSRHTSSANTAIYPNLGLLTLMSGLEVRLTGQSVKLAYLDGTVVGNVAIREFLQRHADEIEVFCVTVLTANYGAGLEMCRLVKSGKASVTTILGNDHFSALSDRVLRNRPEVDVGFYGNDVVEGFVDYVIDTLDGRQSDQKLYPGLVYRTGDGAIASNSENSAEYHRLSLVNYGLIDSVLPHRDKYLDDQKNTYFFMRERELRSQVIDIGRGCIKFAGPRTLQQVPSNACDFCGIIPGVKEIISPDAERAWRVVENAFVQGYNYLYVTADELPLTIWPMLREMIAHKPAWYTGLSAEERPAMFGYTRAEAFTTVPDRVRALIDELNFDHFFIGFDGMTDISLRVMNKQAVGGRGRKDSPMQHNLAALDSMVAQGGLVTAGIVVTHLGITREIMDANLQALRELVEQHPRTFAALDFGPLCPIPGSQSFTYLTHPEYAERRAASFGLRVDRAFLDGRKDFYRQSDEFNMDELVYDFTRGCCPDIDPDLVEQHIAQISELADRYGIVIGGGV